MTTHAPGPWEARLTSNRPGAPWLIQDIKFRTIATVEHREGDACLIAAAPELLAMLRRIAPVLQEHGPATPARLWQDLWALIDKAEGRES